MFLDNHRRLLFASNYDGSLDSYMDDFINKVAFGLNLVFSNGIGYPRTRFLLSGGAQREQEFKNYLRRHQVPTQVWYKAYPGLTAADLATNTQIREGLAARAHDRERSAPLAGADMSPFRPAEADDIQGLLWSGYGGLPEAAFLLLRIRDPQAARGWLREVHVTTVADLVTRQATALQIALSATGSARLGVARIHHRWHSRPSSCRAWQATRRARAGWAMWARNAPALLELGRRGRAGRPADALCRSGQLAAWKAELTASIRQSGFDVMDGARHHRHGRQGTVRLHRRRQPAADRLVGQAQAGNARSDPEYGNLLSIGEFLLGYRNEYGLYTERPLLPASRGDLLPPAEEQPDLRDLGRNGTLSRAARAPSGRPRLLAVPGRTGRPGRRRGAGRGDGGPAQLGRSARPDAAEPIRGVGPRRPTCPRNQFTYDDDPRDCAVRSARMSGARTRAPAICRAVGRGWLARLMRMLGLTRSDLRSDLDRGQPVPSYSAARPRIRHTGSSRTRRCSPGAPDPQSGLHFICLNANIARQFEFIQNAWLISAKFDGLEWRKRSAPRQSRALPIGHPTDGFTHAASERHQRAGIEGLPPSSPCAAGRISSCRACGRCASLRRRVIGSFTESAAPRITSAAFSATMYTAPTMKKPGMRGNTEASTTRSPCVPCTRKSLSSTPPCIAWSDRAGAGGVVAPGIVAHVVGQLPRRVCTAAPGSLLRDRSRARCKPRVIRGARSAIAVDHRAQVIASGSLPSSK